MKKRGRWVAAIGMMTAVLLTVLLSCNSRKVISLTELTNSNEQTEKELGTKEQTSETRHSAKRTLKMISYGDCKFGIKDCQIIQKWNAEYVLVTNVFQNKAEEETSFSRMLEMDAYQNGVEMDEANLFLKQGFSTSQEHKKVLPGSEIEVQKVWKLTESGGVLTLTVKEPFDYDAKPYLVRFELPE